MARDYEDIHDIDDLSDDELTGLVREHLAAHNMIDPDDIFVRSVDGVVHLEGRVGTEGELRVAEHVVTDVLGIVDVSNELVVDPIRRGESPEAVDDHLADEDRRSGLLLGDMPKPLTDEVAQVADQFDDRNFGLNDEQTFGTTDVQKAIESGAAYIPPESPTPEGFSGADVDPNAMGEDH
jgi:BON domain